MKFVKFLLYWILIVVFTACANRASGPTGGPKDSIPPIVVRTVPVNGALNYKKKEIQVFFDENISLEKVNENLIVSPPQKTQPLVKANAKVLTVTFQEELQDSITCSILFGNAIVDLNEKNPLKNYTFSFATGDEIDTLQVSGLLINAENLAPVSGILVGLHRNLHDTAIMHDHFVRIAKTDEDGRFTIRNVKEGKYKLYALADLNKDFKYQPGEKIAFYDSIVIPEVKTVQQTDTIRKDSVTIDTVRVSYTHVYKPDSLVLSLFTENRKRQYLVKSERPAERYFNLFFNDKQSSLPEIKALNFDVNTHFLIQETARKDSLVYWITDSTVYKQDTLKVELSYLKSDSLFNLVLTADTLTLALRKRHKSDKAKKTEEPLVVPLNFKTNLTGNFDLYQDVLIEIEEPLDTFVTEKIKLLQKVDSLFKPIDYIWLPKDSIRRCFALRHAWIPQENYKLQVDSAAFLSIYGKTSGAQETSFKIKSLDEYATLKIVLQHYDSLAVLQVLDSKETVIQSKKIQPQGVVFDYLRPGDYFVRLFLDANNNESWDPGNVEKRLQSEKVFYFHKKLTLKANWELEESWNHLDPNMFNKRPDDLVKTKQK